MKAFKSVGAFAEHLARLAIELPVLVHHMAEVAAEEVEKTARAEIGFYQDAVESFPEWAELAESTESEKARLGFEPDAPLLRTGDLRQSIERKVEGGEAAVGSNDPRMIWHEEGTRHMPPRPVLGPAMAHSKDRIHRYIALTQAAFLAGQGWRGKRVKA